MKIKGYLVVAGITAFVSWLIFSPDGEAPQNGTVSPESATGTERPLLPKEPQPSPARVQQGIAATGQQPRRDAPPWTSAPSRTGYASRPDALDRYSFRPLTERERERLESDRTAADPYVVPPFYPPEAYSQTPWATQSEAGRPGWRDDRGSRPAQPLQGEGYGFFPDRGPESAYSYPRSETYPTRPGREEPVPDPSSTWMDRSAPQWGSQSPDWRPPEERMYPSLGTPLDRKLSAR